MAIVLAVVLYLVLGFLIFLTSTLGRPSKPNIVQQFMMLPYTLVIAVVKLISR